MHLCTSWNSKLDSSTENSYHTLIVPHAVRLYTMIWCMKWQTEAFRGDWELAVATLSKHWQECLVCKPHIKPGSLCALNLTCMRKRIATLTEVTGEILHASLLLFWTPSALTQRILLWAYQFIHIHTAYWVRQQIGYLIACLLLLLHFVKQKIQFLLSSYISLFKVVLECSNRCRYHDQDNFRTLVLLQCSLEKSFGLGFQSSRLYM